MGIFNFFGWFKKRFPHVIYEINNSFDELLPLKNIQIDNLLIDANGLFHNSTQKVYKYGNFKPPFKVLIKENRFTQQQVHEDICNTIENLIITVNPTKRVIICIDGPAPMAKQQQQRSRRFKSSLTRVENDLSFDSTQISPGTKFMDNLSKYIDWFIRKKITENPLWQNLEIIFSTEKIEGEGEYKIMSYLRKYGNFNESYCLHGLDADLIMLSLSTHIPNFYILRDDLYNPKNNYLLIDIGSVRNNIIDIMKWECSEDFEDDKGRKNTNSFKPDWVINDFVFLCFLVGNDFLHHIPSLEIVEDGIEIIFDLCKNIGKTHGHITYKNNGQLYFSKYSLKKFFESITLLEHELLENKFKNRVKYFPDDLLTSCAYFEDEQYKINIDKYRATYIEKHFLNEDGKDISDTACHDYLTGLQWILTYYSSHVPSWNWNYKFHYSPLASCLINHIDSFSIPKYRQGNPTPPFLQLLNILPTKSADILPKPLNEILRTKLTSFYPIDTPIDLSGKRKEYEGIVLLPPMDHNYVKKLYDENLKFVDPKELRRNILNKTLSYKYDERKNKLFK